jgi:TctA family transporter
MNVEALNLALFQTFQAQNLFYVVIGVVAGVIVGALPGMTSVMLLAILVE